MAWVGRRKVVSITRYEQHSLECAICGADFEDCNDPYHVELDDGSSVDLCDNCGPSFARILGVGITEADC